MTTQDRVLDLEILIETDEDGFHVWCPALKGCHSFGLTLEEARDNIKEAIELWLDDTDEDLSEILPRRERVEVPLP